MQRIMMKSKIHRATVTGADLNYVGSITLDTRLMELADIREHVHLLVLTDVGQLHQAGVEGDRADVVEIGTGDGRPVDLRLHHDPSHH